MDWIEEQTGELTGDASPFKFGVMKALWEIHRLNQAEERLDEWTETNANGEPVGVPYFIDTTLPPRPLEFLNAEKELQDQVDNRTRIPWRLL